MNRFWEDLNGCIKGYSPNNRIAVLGDLNEKVENAPYYNYRRSVSVVGVNNNGDGVVWVCVCKKEFLIGNNYFGKKEVHKYKRV